MATRTDQIREGLERELAAVRSNQIYLKAEIHEAEQHLIHWETREERILDQLAELDGNDLVVKEEIQESESDYDWLNEPIEVDLDTNAQGNTVH